MYGRYYNVEKESHQKMNKKIYDEIATAIQSAPFKKKASF